MDTNLTECIESCSQKCLGLYPQTQAHKYLEMGLIFLIIILVALSLFIGWKRLTEGNKKKYLKLKKVLDDEYMLQIGDNDYYLKKGELK